MDNILCDFLTQTCCRLPRRRLCLQSHLGGTPLARTSCASTLQEEGLKLRLKKCIFDLQEIEYLGYIVSAGQILVSTKSRVCCILASAYDAEEGSQFVAIMQLLRQFHSSL
jgi:hypothetical protein